MNFLQVRYRYDNPAEHGISMGDGALPVGSARTRMRLLAESVKIAPALFPRLAQAFEGVGEAMGLNQELDCFVSADALMQAYCVPHSSQGGESFSVVLSSSLVERLEPEEIRFVIGHEVGHFSCEHWRYPRDDEAESLGDRLAALRLSRSAEISADRIGMLACGSLDHSCGAMIKVAAGLGAPHLRPDIPSILSQFRELSGADGDWDAIWSTHPIIPLRIRALLRFDPLCRLLLDRKDLDEVALGELDEQIERDFQKASGNALKRLNDQRLESVRIWGLLFLFCADGVISKAEQRLMSEVLGEDTSGKVLRFLKSQDRSPGQAVAAKLELACADAMTADRHARQGLIEEFEVLIEEAGLLDGPIQEAMRHLRQVLLDAS